MNIVLIKTFGTILLILKTVYLLKITWVFVLARYELRCINDSEEINALNYMKKHYIALYKNMFNLNIYVYTRYWK